MEDEPQADAQQEITRLLATFKPGDSLAQSRLLAAVYSEMRSMAQKRMSGERRDHTLQPTDLVHEAYLRLVASGDRTWQNRHHFFSVAARIMRRILVDYARARNAQKRKGIRLSLDEGQSMCLSPENCAQIVEINDVLDKLKELDDRQAQIVEMRFFAGLTEEEIGDILGISTRTVKREWRFAKAWLSKELSCEQGPAGRAAASGDGSV